ncbi:MAG: hypothetical protein HHJ09_02675 [Glaciimonas sp.]|nr:hypothetical protein [Glaciimonas sp.]
MSVINCFDCLISACSDDYDAKKFRWNTVNFHIDAMAAAYTLRETAVTAQPGYWAQNKGTR